MTPLPPLWEPDFAAPLLESRAAAAFAGSIKTSSAATTWMLNRRRGRTAPIFIRLASPLDEEDQFTP
jgi:hypothetical protein